MTYARMSDPARGKRHFPIDDATNVREAARARRQTMWVIMKYNTPVLVCASHGIACRKARQLRKLTNVIDTGALFTVVETPLMKVYH